MVNAGKLPPPPPRVTQWSFTSTFEGVVPHLYVDSRGHMTCGVGFLVPNEAALDAYPWHPSIATARADWRVLRSMPPGHTPGYYRRAACARLTDADVRRIFDVKVAEFRAAIDKRWRLATQPECVQIALVDMAYALGAGGLAEYRRMYAAVMRRDWPAAAAECKRGGVQPSRDAATMALIASAAGGVP